MAAIEMRRFGLSHPGPDGGETLFRDADLDLEEHGFYLLMGTSGGGKSSLLKLLAGLDEPREPRVRIRGEVRVLGRSLRGGYPRALRGRVAAILQDEGLLDDLGPRENVELALRVAGGSVRLAPALLAQAGIEDPPPHTALLSGGMRKRVAVARALASSPHLLLCDEPTAGLDPRSAREIADVLRAAHDASPERTTIVVTHDREAFEGLCDGIVILDRRGQTLRLESASFVPPPSLEDAATSGSPSEDDPTTSLHEIRSLLLRAVSVGETIAESIVRLPPIEVGEAARSVVRLVLEPVLFVVAAGAVLGGLATFFALRNNPVEGAFEAALLQGTGKVSVAVLVPLFCGLFFAARTAAGATARIGTMKRTNQIAALTMMGIRPADHLLTPLVWGMTVAMPVVTAAGVVAASLAAALASWLVAGFAPAAWAASWFGSVRPDDVLSVLAKASLSGFGLAVCCYHLGSGPKRSGADVGEAVNGSIVAGMALVLAIHVVLTVRAYG